MQLELGDKVTSKKIGLPMTGTVVGIMEAELYAAINKTFILSGYLHHWNNYYPDWVTEPIVYVKFDKPQFAFSKEELRPIFERTGTKLTLDQWYNEYYQPVHVTVYPAADLTTPNFDFSEIVNEGESNEIEGTFE